MTAVDPDDIEQKRGVAYAINGSVIPKSMSLFKIHSKTGEIKTIKALDYEDMKEHILIIEAKDEEKNARTSLFSVVISVDDVNDHKPVFLKSDFEAEVNVNSSPGTSIIKAFAFDEDDGTNALLKFSIKGGNRNEAFYIDQNSGIIQVAKNLDPTFNKYTLQIHVSDSGSPAKTAEAQVEVSLYSVTLFKFSIAGIWGWWWCLEHKFTSILETGVLNKICSGKPQQKGWTRSFPLIYSIWSRNKLLKYIVHCKFHRKWCSFHLSTGKKRLPVSY